MQFGQTEAIIVAAFSVLWWLFYFFIKARAERKYLRSGEHEDYLPCQGCLVTQAAMLAAVTLSALYLLIEFELVKFS